jgi:hypothetical protein
MSDGCAACTGRICAVIAGPGTLARAQMGRRRVSPGEWGLVSPQLTGRVTAGLSGKALGLVEVLEIFGEVAAHQTRQARDNGGQHQQHNVRASSM